MNEADMIRRLLADGWGYSTRQLEPVDGGGLRPVLLFSRDGYTTRMESPIIYSSERAAWLWCDAWSRRALLWADNPDQGVLG